jgi:hypothetical protein
VRQLALTLAIVGLVELTRISSRAADAKPAEDNPYAVPEGGVAPLVEFIQRVSQLRPDTPQEDYEYRTQARLALREAAQRIIKLEPDAKSEAHQVARFVLLVERIRALAQREPEQQRKTVDDVRSYARELVQTGQDQVAADVTILLGDTLVRSGEWKMLADTYQPFAELFTGSKHERLRGRLRDLEANKERALAAIKVVEAAGKKTVIRPQGRLVPLELKTHCNAKLRDLSGPGDFEGNGLAEVPLGEQVLCGVQFAIGEGLIQLGSTSASEKPAKAEGVPVQRKVARLYALHAVQWTLPEPQPGRPVVGEFRLHYEDGSTASLPIVYGEDVRDWWASDGGIPVTRGRVVWTGSNLRTDQYSASLRLYLSAWENSHPDKQVTALDYLSTMKTPCAPFCVALTVEEP